VGFDRLWKKPIHSFRYFLKVETCEDPAEPILRVSQNCTLDIPNLVANMLNSERDDKTNEPKQRGKGTYWSTEEPIQFLSWRIKVS